MAGSRVPLLCSLTPKPMVLSDYYQILSGLLKVTRELFYHLDAVSRMRGSPGDHVARRGWFVVLLLTNYSTAAFFSGAWKGMLPSSFRQMLFRDQLPSPYPSAVLEISSSQHQERIEHILGEIEAGRVPTTPDQFKNLFQSLLVEAGNARTDKPLRVSGVIRHMLEQENFLKKTLPFLASIAKRFKLLFPEGLTHLTRTHPQKHLRRIQVLALLSAAFFGIIPHDQRKLLRSYGSLELNKLDLFHRGFFERKPKVDVDGDILLSDGELQVDFADRFVGGLSVFSDHVAQEELFFAIRPELLVVMLFLQTLADDEALVVKGAESFVLYSGYEHSFNVYYPKDIPSGSHWSVHGLTPLDSLGRRETTVVAIDALEVKWDFDMQYTDSNIRREILKASLGFQGDPFEELVSSKRAPVATGKWGCFIFGGDNELKSLIQWIAASYAGRVLHFNAFGDGKLTRMQHTLMQVGKKFPTIRQLVEAIEKCAQQKPEGHQKDWSLWKCLLHL